MRRRRAPRDPLLPRQRKAVRLESAMPIWSSTAAMKAGGHLYRHHSIILTWQADARQRSLDRTPPPSFETTWKTGRSTFLHCLGKRSPKRSLWARLGFEPSLPPDRRLHIRATMCCGVGLSYHHYGNDLPMPHNPKRDARQLCEKFCL
jgi:hypothetical protein